MAAEASEVSGATKRAINLIQISGRVNFVERLTDGRHVHEVILPAPDEYSRPQVVPVFSQGQLGAPGQDVLCICRPEGWVRTRSSNGVEYRNRYVRFVVVER